MKKILIAFVVLGITGAVAYADVLATWDVNGVDVADGTGIDENISPYRFTAALAANVSDAKLSLSANVNPSTTVGQYGFKVSSGEEQTTLAGAITAGHYFQFTITPVGGYYVNLSSIEMTGQSSSTGANDVALLSSIDGFSEGTFITSVNNIAGTTGGFDTTTDLSANKYQSLSETVTFRVYGWNTSSGSGITYLRDPVTPDLQINGTTSVIPEPASLGLVAVFAAIALWQRRRIKG